MIEPQEEEEEKNKMDDNEDESLDEFVTPPSSPPPIFLETSPSKVDSDLFEVSWKKYKLLSFRS